MVTQIDLLQFKISDYPKIFTKKLWRQKIKKQDVSSLTLDHNIGWMNLKDAYQLFFQSKLVHIPFSIWLIENPDSPISLPGSIHLKNHDCIHILLNRGISIFDEAFIVGYTMGNCENIKNIHVSTYKVLSKLLYPQDYKFGSIHLKVFDLGFMYGQKVHSKNIHLVDFGRFKHQPIKEIRVSLGIDFSDIYQLWNAEKVLIG